MSSSFEKNQLDELYGMGELHELYGVPTAPPSAITGSDVVVGTGNIDFNSTQVYVVVGGGDQDGDGGDCETDSGHGDGEEEEIGRAELVQQPNQTGKALQFNETSSRYEIKRDACVNLLLPEAVKEKAKTIGLKVEFDDQSIDATELVSCRKHRPKGQEGGKDYVFEGGEREFFVQGLIDK